MKITKDSYRYTHTIGETIGETINEKLISLDVIACLFCMEAGTENYILTYYFK